MPSLKGSKNPSYKHGHNRRGKPSRTYISWRNAIQRCTNPDNPDYKYWGGRGITVCKRWLKFENFLADLGPKPKGLTLGRIDNNKGYFPGNVEYVTWTEQQRNSRNCNFPTYDGRTQLLSAWAKEIGISLQTLSSRVNKLGWPVERALSLPAGQKTGPKPKTEK